MNIVAFISSNTYRIGVLVLTIVCALGIFYLTVRTRPVMDPVPDIKPVTPEKYNEWAQYADTINAGIYITNFAVSDFAQGLFMVDAYVWFQFNPLIFSVETVNQFNIDKGRIFKKQTIESVKVGHDIFVRYLVRFEVKSNLNFKYYPFDSHRIYMTLKYDALSPSEVILATSFSRAWFGDNAVSPNWDNGSPTADFGYIEAWLDTRNKSNIAYISAALIYFDFARATIREAVLVLLPYVLLLFMVLGSLLMALDPFQMVLFTILSILGMNTYRIVVGHMSPLTSYYMLSDCIFLLTLVCASLVVIFEIISAVYTREDNWWFELLRSGVLTVSSMLFLVGWFYLLYIW